MLKYVKNIGYILQHKWYVLLECWKEGLYWQGLVHDLSKFSPAEFSAKEAVPMPEKYIIEMICDWRAMARKFGDTAQEHFKKNHHRMLLHPETFERVQLLLNIRVTPANIP